MVKTEEKLIKLKEAHFKRIELLDAILVVSVNNIDFYYNQIWREKK